MDGKIAIEEHFVTPEREDLVLNPGWAPDAFRHTLDRLENFEGERLQTMDRHGIEIAVLSLASDGIQAIADPGEATARARQANDALAAIVPVRGVLVSGYSGAEDAPEAAAYYDDERFWPFWETLERLRVPLYLHPRNPLASQRRIYDGRAELLGPTWAFGVETATHALRLIVSGLFDRFPSLTAIRGHLGEGRGCHSRCTGSSSA
jgi:predicted TIM-barrel fold metal-dependent hydrolase